MSAARRRRKSTGSKTSVVVWGTTFAAIRIGLQGVPPFTAASLRFLIAGSALLLLALVRRVPLGRSRTERRLWLANGLLSFSVSYGLTYWAEQWVPSSLAAVIFASLPLFVALLAHLLLPGERLSRRSLVGILIGFAGIGVIFSEDLGRVGGPGTAKAAALMLLAPVMAALATVSVKRWGKGISSLSLTSVPMLLGAGVLGVAAGLVEGDRSVTWTPPATAALLYLSLVGSGVVFLLFYWLLQRLPATHVALIAYATPVVAVVVGIVFLGEEGTLRTLLGSTVVVLGVVAASRGQTSAQGPPAGKPPDPASPSGSAELREGSGGW